MRRHEIVEALLFFLGLYLLSRTSQNWTSIRRKFRYRNSHDWPLSQAVVRARRIERRDSRARNNYHVVLEYSYSVGGKCYGGSYKSDAMYFETDAKRFCERFPAGMSIMARVNPERPKDSVLELPR